MVIRKKLIKSALFVHLCVYLNRFILRLFTPLIKYYLNISLSFNDCFKTHFFKSTIFNAYIL